MEDIGRNRITSLDGIINDQNRINSNERKAKDYIEELIQSLLSRNGANSRDTMILRGDVLSLEKAAQLADQIANDMEKGKYKKLEEKNLEEIKAVLMQTLGVPAEFVEQLSILVKTGDPRALREAAGVYREAAQDKRKKLDERLQDMEHIEKDIHSLRELLDNVTDKTEGNVSMVYKQMNAALRAELLRNLSEEEFRHMLEQADKEHAGSF